MLKILSASTLSASCDQVMGDTKSVRLSEFSRQLSNRMPGMFLDVVTLIKLLLVMPTTNASRVKGHFQHFVVLKSI